MANLPVICVHSGSDLRDFTKEEIDRLIDWPLTEIPPQKKMLLQLGTCNLNIFSQIAEWKAFTLGIFSH